MNGEPRDLWVTYRTRVVHRIDCGHRSGANRLGPTFQTLAGQRAYAESQGMKPCRRCKPFKGLIGGPS